MGRSDVLAASERLVGRVRRTPVLQTTVITDRGDDVPVALKLEYLQAGGSFKIRGSLNALLAAATPPERVVIASGGNAGIAAAIASRQQQIPCVVVVPTTAPHAKVQALQGLGAEVVLHGDRYADAFQRATDIATEQGALQLHAYDLPDVVAGAGVIGLEIAEQIPACTSILVAVGGGGLVAGIAAATGDGVKIVGVEPTGIPTLHAALAAGTPVDVNVNSIAADALGASRLGTIAMDVVQRRGVESVLVDDAAIVAARRQLWERYRIVVELAGATALAAIICGAYVPAPDEHPVVVLCGANTDPAAL
nr:serine/threonine dehydratase [Spelaeibacter cavernicola]